MGLCFCIYWCIIVEVDVVVFINFIWFIEELFVVEDDLVCVIKGWLVLGVLVYLFVEGLLLFIM